VSDLGLRARESGVHLELDCGFVPCMFPDGAMAALGLGSAEVGLRCSPMLDLLPDGQVIPCYPLAALGSEALASEHDASWLRQRFSKRQRAERAFTLYRECGTCARRERGECSGGCLAASSRRVRRQPFEVAVPVPA
jgi:radical SAM protein with 4Fe4S-binding SPASM domain